MKRLGPIIRYSRLMNCCPCVTISLLLFTFTYKRKLKLKNIDTLKLPIVFAFGIKFDPLLLVSDPIDLKTKIRVYRCPL